MFLRIDFSDNFFAYITAYREYIDNEYSLLYALSDLFASWTVK